MEKKRPRNEKQTGWSRSWNEGHLDRLFVTVPKGLKQRIQAHAKQHGESVNALIGRLLRHELNLSEDEWREEKRKG